MAWCPRPIAKPPRRSRPRSSTPRRGITLSGLHQPCSGGPGSLSPCARPRWLHRLHEASHHRVGNGSADPDASLYEPHLDKHGVAMWKCLGTDQRIPHSRINDDYCDCEDGSDEPGTSACDEGRFYCANAGHIPKYIRSSFVNDGVCDCCDGSDEAEGKTHCPNVCAQMNKEYRKETAQAEKKYQAGAKIRERYVSSAAQDREFHRKNFARLYTELPEAERTEAQLKQALEDAESVSAWLEQQKRSSPLFAQLELRQATLRAQREALDKLAGELRIVAQMVERLGGVPSKEDIADIRDAYHIWLGRVFDDHDEERQATLDEKLSQLLRSGTEFSEEDLQTLINEDPLTLLDGAPDYAGQAPPAVPQARTLS